MLNIASLVETLVGILIGSVLTTLVGLWAFRNWWSRSKSIRPLRIQVKELKKALRVVMNHYHHGGISSRGKSARGLISLAIMAQKRILKDSKTFVKPIHPKCSDLLELEILDTINILEKTVEQIVQIEESNIKPIKEFEHLQ